MLFGKLNLRRHITQRFDQISQHYYSTIMQNDDSMGKQQKLNNIDISIFLNYNLMMKSKLNPRKRD